LNYPKGIRVVDEERGKENARGDELTRERVISRVFKRTTSYSYGSWSP